MDNVPLYVSPTAVRVVGVVMLSAAVGFAVVALRARRGRQTRRRGGAFALVAAGYVLFGGELLLARDGPPWVRAVTSGTAVVLVAAGLTLLQRSGIGRLGRTTRARTAAASPSPAVLPGATAAFVACLPRLTAADWEAAIARAVAHADARAGARAVLDTIVAERGYARVDRYLAHVVAYAVASGRLRASRVPPPLRSAAVATGRVAALALLLRPTLSATDFATLYAPFEDAMPSRARADAAGAGHEHGPA